MAGGGWPDSAFKNEYEYNYIEVLVLIVLLLLALTFESIWHRIQEHVRENAYVYGSLHEHELAEAVARRRADNEHNPHLHGTCQKHVKLADELVNRAGGEFMTLGFLAFCTFMFNTLQGFEWLVATCPPSGSIALPKTQVDWLHLVEGVHMKLFVGMVFYFALISRVVHGAIRKIKKWEQMQLRYAKGHTTDLSRVALAVDSDLTEYLVWRSYFIQRLIATEDRRPALYRALFRELGLSRKAPDAKRHLREKIERCFSFSAYISLNVEQGVRDSIEVHQFTWFWTILLFCLFALLHRFAHVSLRALTPTFIGAAFVILGTMRFTVIRTQRKIFEATSAEGSGHCDPVPQFRGGGSMESLSPGGGRSPALPGLEDPAVQDGDAYYRPDAQQASMVAQVSSAPRRPDRRLFHERWQTELIMNRVLQILLYLISYVFARTVMDFHDWSERPAVTGLLTSLFVTLFALLVYFLPSYVPVFLGVMALPPYVDDGNLAAFFGVIEQMRSKEEKDKDATVEETLWDEQSLAPTTEGFFRGVTDGSSQVSVPPEFFGVIHRLEQRIMALEERAPTLPAVQASAWRRAGAASPGGGGRVARGDGGSEGIASSSEEKMPQTSAWRQVLMSGVRDPAPVRQEIV